MAGPPPQLPPFRRRSSVGLYLSMAGYAFFALLGIAAFLGIVRPWESREVEPPPAVDAGPPPVDAGPPPVDAGPPPPVVSVFRGTLATSPDMRFGGRPYCDYEASFSELEIEIRTEGVDDAGRPIPNGGRAAATYEEREVGSCPHEIVPSNRHELTFASVEPAGEEIVIRFTHASGSPPLEGTFRGGFGDGVLDGTLELRRTQAVSPRLMFQVQVAMRLSRAD